MLSHGELSRRCIASLVRSRHARFATQRRAASSLCSTLRYLKASAHASRVQCGALRTGGTRHCAAARIGRSLARGAHAAPGRGGQVPARRRRGAGCVWRFERAPVRGDYLSLAGPTPPGRQVSALDTSPLWILGPHGRAQRRQQLAGQRAGRSGKGGNAPLLAGLQSSTDVILLLQSCVLHHRLNGLRRKPRFICYARVCGLLYGADDNCRGKKTMGGHRGRRAGGACIVQLQRAK